ncbi:MAG TPA: phage portal protein, partial [Thermopetrobacter sp.]|nr:phage portal protein [Thermopetrobacter sp.]
GTPVRLKSGAFLPLPLGARVASYNPDRPNTAFGSFVETVLRHIAAGLHIPYELLAKDFSKTNYSSARAALLEAWRYFNGRRRWLTDYWLRPIYELWMEEAVDAGLIEAPGFYANRDAYTACRWIFAGRGWVDPVKEAQAAKIRMETGLSTLEAECAEQGLDWEDVLRQQRREMDLRQELGLPEPDTAAIMQASPPSDRGTPS